MSIKTTLKHLSIFAVACICFIACLGTTANAAQHPVNGNYVDYTYDTPDTDVIHSFTLATSGTVTINVNTTFSTAAIVYNASTDEPYVAATNHGIYGQPSSPATETFKLDLEAGNYYIKISGSSLNEHNTGTYRIKIAQTASGVNEKEPNDSFEQAMALNSGTLITGFISPDNIHDFYKITIQSNQKILVTMILHDNATGQTGKNLTVYNADYEKKGEHFFYSETVGGSNTKEFELAKGTYYLKVDNAGLHQYTGKYQIRWTKAPVKVESIKVSGDKSVNAGKQITLKATVLPADADNKAVTWTSSNPSVATVNSAGVVTGKKIGKATITATSADGTKVTGTYNICVGPKQVSGLKAKAKGNKKVQLRWSKQKGITGIQVQYAKKNTFKGSKKKTVKVSSNATKATVKLKKGTYYVKVRAITKIDGKKYYGDWSKAKKVKIK